MSLNYIVRSEAVLGGYPEIYEKGVTERGCCGARKGASGSVLRGSKALKGGFRGGLGGVFWLFSRFWTILAGFREKGPVL